MVEITQNSSFDSCSPTPPSGSDPTTSSRESSAGSIPRHCSSSAEKPAEAMSRTIDAQNAGPGMIGVALALPAAELHLSQLQMGSSRELKEATYTPRRPAKVFESPLAFSLDLVAGGAVACVAHSVVAPIERIKLVLQTQDSNIAMLSGRHRHYKGFFDALGTIVREEGFWSLWRGNLTSIIRYIPSMSLNFAFKDYYRVMFAPAHGGSAPSAARIAAGNLAAGAAAGATSLFFTYPLDIAHTRLATDVGARKQFAGLLGFLRSTYTREGVRGLYHGFPASVHGIIVHRSIYFGGFDSAKQLLLKSESSKSSDGGHTSGPQTRGHTGPFWMRWLLAQGATTTASLVSYPFDTVRHRMMMQSGVECPEYHSTVECWKKILRKEGVRGFYKGLMSNILRGTGAAFVLVMYDELQGHIHRALHCKD